MSMNAFGALSMQKNDAVRQKAGKMKSEGGERRKVAIVIERASKIEEKLVTMIEIISPPYFWRPASLLISKRK